MTREHRGFTLIELMIVIAIIGILAAIAIPKFLRFQLKSKTSEGKGNLAAIRTAEEAYLAEFGEYVAAAIAPTGVLTPMKQAWPAAAPGFDAIGWGPEGDVYFSYGIAAPLGASGFTISASADLDGNGVAQAWGYTRPDGPNGRIAASHGSCNVADLPADNQVAPCDAGGAAVFGQSEF